MYRGKKMSRPLVASLVFALGFLFFWQHGLPLFGDILGLSRMAVAKRQIVAGPRGNILDRQLRVLVADGNENPDHESADSRIYPQGRTAIHVVGLSEKNEGMTGLESAFDASMTARSLDPTQKEAFALPSRSGREGFHLVTTLSLPVQKRMEFLLEGLKKESGARFASGGIVLVSSGEVLALASHPSYDPKNFWGAEDQNIHNHFLIDKVPLGAFAHLFARACVMTLKNSSIETPDERDMLAFARQRLGMERPLLQDLPPENESVSPSPWNALHREQTLLSPMQIMAGLAGLASDRRFAGFHLVTALVDRDSGAVFPRKTKAAAALPVSAAADNALFVSDAEGHWQAYSWVPDAAGTGTGSLLLAGLSGTGRQRCLLLFSLVGARDPEQMAAGQDLSIRLTPLLGAMKTLLADNKALPTVLPQRKNGEMTGLALQASTAATDPSSVAPGRAMPNVTGASLREGLKQLSDLDLQVQVTGSGRIVEQFPAAGVLLTKKQHCRLILTKSFSSPAAPPRHGR